MPRGGPRVGAGRKRKWPRDAEGRVIRHPSSAVMRGVVPPEAPLTVPAGQYLPPTVAVEAPEDLSEAARAVWDRQAPHALAVLTLTPATAFSFARYCAVVAAEQDEAKSTARGGANHRGLLKQIESYEQRFLLTAMGRPMAAPAAPEQAENEDEEFFGTGRAR